MTYREIAKFNKSLDELETLYDKWLYALKNLYKLTQRPKALCFSAMVQQNFFVQDDSPKPEETTMMPAAEEKGFTPAIERRTEDHYICEFIGCQL